MTDKISNDPSSATPQPETPIATEASSGVRCSAWLGDFFACQTSDPMKVVKMINFFMDEETPSSQPKRSRSQ
jgi:hypothetical protein